jgi:hypothetical protein
LIDWSCMERQSDFAVMRGHEIDKQVESTRLGQAQNATLPLPSGVPRLEFGYVECQERGPIAEKRRVARTTSPKDVEHRQGTRQLMSEPRTSFAILGSIETFSRPGVGRCFRQIRALRTITMPYRPLEELDRLAQIMHLGC